MAPVAIGVFAIRRPASVKSSNALGLGKATVGIDRGVSKIYRQAAAGVAIAAPRAMAKTRLIRVRRDAAHLAPVAGRVVNWLAASRYSRNTTATTAGVIQNQIL